MMPQSYGYSAKLNSAVPSQYDYYQHDDHETLDTMTAASPAATELPSMRSISTPTFSVASSAPSASSIAYSFSASSRVVSRDGQFPHRIISDEGSKIPRRVKSNPGTSTNTNVGQGSSSNVSLAGGSKAKRSNLTSSGMSVASSVVSNCLLTSLGGGDGVSLDPDVDIWLDIIPLSRKPFKNFHRDFADGVLMAEIMAHFFPKKVDLHNYVPASSSSAKKANYDTLNQKVFSKMGVKLADNLIDGVIHAKPGYIEKALQQVHRLIDSSDRKYVETRAKELSCLAGSFDGSPTLLAPFAQELCLVRSLPGEIPDCVIYQNIKYYPSTTMEENSKTENQLLEKNNELCNKVKRLETLLGLKESHLQDLTSKIHELRAKYETSKQRLPDY